MANIVIFINKMTDIAIKNIAFTTALIVTLMPIFEIQVKKYFISLFPKHEKLVKHAWMAVFLVCAITAWWTGIKIISKEST